MVFEVLVRVGVVLVIVALAVLGLPALFIGAGYLLSLFLPLGIFQCALLSLGSVGLVALVYIAIAAGTYWTQAAFDDEDELEDFEDAFPYLGDEELDELL
jgi:hypothetical protein